MRQLVSDLGWQILAQIPWPRALSLQAAYERGWAASGKAKRDPADRRRITELEIGLSQMTTCALYLAQEAPEAHAVADVVLAAHHAANLLGREEEPCAPQASTSTTTSATATAA